MNDPHHLSIQGGGPTDLEGVSSAPLWEEDYRYCRCCYGLKLKGECVWCVSVSSLVTLSYRLQVTTALSVGSAIPTLTMILR